MEMVRLRYRKQFTLVLFFGVEAFIECRIEQGQVAYRRGIPRL